MKLDKAIEVLENEHRRTWGDGFPKIRDAIKLGIEALKWRRQIEQEDPEITLEPLPGETEE